MLWIWVLLMITTWVWKTSKRSLRRSKWLDWKAKIVLRRVKETFTVWKQAKVIKTNQGSMKEMQHIKGSASFQQEDHRQVKQQLAHNLWQIIWCRVTYPVTWDRYTQLGSLFLQLDIILNLKALQIEILGSWQLILHLLTIKEALNRCLLQGKENWTHSTTFNPWLLITKITLLLRARKVRAEG